VSGENEEWRPVVGWEGLYEVSSRGRVKRGSKVLKIWINNDGYGQIGLSNGTHKRQKLVHRLVLESFRGPHPPDMPLGLHGAKGKADNSVDNLYWGNNAMNMKDRARDGTNVNLNKTHCPEGHPYSEENTYIPPNGEHRQCRTCNRKRREETRLRGLDPDDSRHGLVGYSVYGCRCDICVVGNREWRREYMRKYRRE
jgi:hypothetical protein